MLSQLALGQRIYDRIERTVHDDHVRVGESGVRTVSASSRGRVVMVRTGERGVRHCGEGNVFYVVTQ